jgi:CelD/BcsL family acetyltransferase involved in cellulose biosynthesis
VLHLRDLLDYAIKAGLRRFDFTIGDERYKLEWSDLRLRLYDHSSAAKSCGWLPNCVSVVRRRLKRFIKQTPLIWRLACRVRSVLGPF